MIVIASILFAAAVGLLSWELIDIATSARQVSSTDGRFEESRRESLRRVSAPYRWCEPLIDEWTVAWKTPPHALSQIDELLSASGSREPWKPAEYRNVKRLEAIGIGVACVSVGMLILGYSLVSSLLIGVAGFYAYQWLTLRVLKSEATVRQMNMKRRFAGAVDLMALMMEVGAGFQDCLDVAAKEAQGTALGDELSLVRKEISMGALRSVALKGLADRTRDPDMIEVIMSINEGEELGTPLTKILRNQADQMRQKRSQWAEKAAEESQVAIVFPAMLIMIACLLVVVAPFVLSVLPGI